MKAVIDEGTAKHMQGTAVDEPAIHALVDLAVQVLVVAAVLGATEFLPERLPVNTLQRTIKINRRDW